MTTDLKRKASEMASPAPTEAEELAALNKALTALGFTDDVKLERFLHVLMPRVIDQMASKHESTKRKVLEILSHVNKRLKAVPAMPLPLEDLTALYINEERPPTGSEIATRGASGESSTLSIRRSFVTSGTTSKLHAMPVRRIAAVEPHPKPSPR